MTRLLWLRAAPLPYETPISNASRNAILNHQTHGVRAFCTDLGLDLRGLQDGEDTAIAQLAQMIGVCPSAYDRGTMRRNGDKFVLRGERLLQASVRRKRIFICPACVSEDIATSSLPPPASACCRGHWLLDSVRSCPEHELELVELQPSNHKAIHDFSVQIAPHLGALEALPRKRATRAEFRFQTYLHDRLDKAASLGFLDQLEFHVAARFCEMLGATLKIGESQALTSLSNRDWLSIGELGFSYAHEGPDGIRAALHDIQRKSTYSRSGNDGIRAMHGRLFKWISHYHEDDAHAPIRDILREHIIATVPVRPGETLLGKVVMERQKLHSVRTASIEAGIPPRQLRKILQALGHLGPEHANRPNSWTVFDAEQHADLLNDIRHSMPLSVASEYLGAGPAHGRLLFEWGFIQPFVRKSAEHPIKEHQFTKQELDDFLSQLLEGASTATASDGERLVSVPAAAKRAICSSMEIVELIMNRQLPTVKRAPGTAGFLSLLFDVDEIRSKVRGEYHGEVTAREACALIRTRNEVVLALISESVLPSRIVRSPKSRRPARVVPLVAIEDFNKTYCTLAEISRSKSVAYSRVQSVLARNGVKPEFSKDRFQAEFYRRSEIAAIEFQ